MKMKNEKGASLIEYGILAGLISVLSIGTVLSTGGEISNMFDGVNTTLSSTLGGEAVADATPLPTDAECYNAANVGTVGQGGWIGCEGMLIANNTMLMGGGTPSVGGDGSAAITTGDGTFTFQNDAMNIFTGQVTNLDVLLWEMDWNGDIGYWDTSNVTSFGATFQDNDSFNADISGWDTSSAVQMGDMFGRAYSFNVDISGWDVSNVTQMSNMFTDVASFNQDLSSWDVSSVTNYSGFDTGTTGWILPKPVFP